MDKNGNKMDEFRIGAIVNIWEDLGNFSKEFRLVSISAEKAILVDTKSWYRWNSNPMKINSKGCVTRESLNSYVKNFRNDRATTITINGELLIPEPEAEIASHAAGPWQTGEPPKDGPILLHNGDDNPVVVAWNGFADKFLDIEGNSYNPVIWSIINWSEESEKTDLPPIEEADAAE